MDVEPARGTIGDDWPADQQERAAAIAAQVALVSDIARLVEYLDDDDLED